MTMCNTVLCNFLALAFSVGLSATAGAVTINIGEDDGFGGLRCGGDCNVGNPYTPDLGIYIAPGAYVDAAGTDASTQTPFTGYKFTFNFAWDATGLSSIDAATVTVQSGSVGRRSGDGTGVGFALVSANAVGLGEFLDTATGVSSGGALEESVKHHVFNVAPLLTAGSSGVLSFMIDGTTLVNPTDLVALDYAELTFTGTEASVAEPGVLGLAGLAVAGVLAARRRR